MAGRVKQSRQGRAGQTGKIMQTGQGIAGSPVRQGTADKPGRKVMVGQAGQVSKTEKAG